MTALTSVPLHVAVLAAGKGTRMKTRRPKLLHRLAGLTLIEHVLATARLLTPGTITLIVGYQGDEIRASLSREVDLRFAVQEPQLGTGHAVMQLEAALAGQAGTLLLLSGDVPLIRPASLRQLVEHHLATAAAATVLTTNLERPYGYGRILRKDGAIVRIVEERDASPEQRKIREINGGIWAFALEGLFDALRQLSTDNEQGEYYLTDLVQTFRKAGRVVETLLVRDATEVRGVNSQFELAEMGTIMKRVRNDELMAAGVTLVDPATAYIDVDVEVGPDTTIHPNVSLEGRTRIGVGCEIRAGSRIVNSTIGDAVVIKNHCVIEDAIIADRAQVGPFAHIRPGTDVGEDARVGNFVELKKTTLGPGSKANHLTYLGDATVGANVNVGAGTITCNYDGSAKHRTHIDDDAFIGSDTQLIAPVTVGRGAYVAAGSTIVEDVPPGALGIARSRQVNKDGWAARKKTGSSGRAG